MRYAWWLIFGLVLFLLCSQQALAVSVAGFNPTDQYVVQSQPFLFSEAEVEKRESNSPSGNSRTLVVEAEKERKKEPTVAPVPNQTESHLAIASKQSQTSEMKEISNEIGANKAKVIEILLENFSYFLSVLADKMTFFTKQSISLISFRLFNTVDSFVLNVSSQLNAFGFYPTYLMSKPIHFLHTNALLFALSIVGIPFTIGTSVVFFNHLKQIKLK